MSSGDEGVWSLEPYVDTEDHDVRPLRSFSLVEVAEFGEYVAGMGGLGANKFGFCTPKLSAVLRFACVYVYDSDSEGDEMDRAMVLTVPARFLGGGWSDGEFMPSELTR